MYTIVDIENPDGQEYQIPYSTANAKYKSARKRFDMENPKKKDESEQEKNNDESESTSSSNDSDSEEY
jgi:hypothetical protein